MNALQGMDRYRREVIQVITRKHDIKVQLIFLRNKHKQKMILLRGKFCSIVCFSKQDFFYFSTSVMSDLSKCNCTHHLQPTKEEFGSG